MPRTAWTIWEKLREKGVMSQFQTMTCNPRTNHMERIYRLTRNSDGVTVCMWEKTIQSMKVEDIQKQLAIAAKGRVAA